MSDAVRVVLDEKEIPRQWYNLNADFRRPAPVCPAPTRD